MRRLGITGTDTGVGKTTVACAILAAMRSAGLRTSAMKPIETGVSPSDDGTDAHRLRALATAPHPLSIVSPYRFPDPLAPLAAADRAGAAIDPRRLDAAFDDLGRAVDAVVVEGAGGLLVPVTADMSVLELFRRWSLELVVVASNRLGVLNHVLLTERAAAAAGLKPAVIVLSEPQAADASTAGNAGLLQRLTTTPVRRFPRLTDPSDPAELAAGAAAAGLDVLFSDPLTTSQVP